MLTMFSFSIEINPILWLKTTKKGREEITRDWIVSVYILSSMSAVVKRLAMLTPVPSHFLKRKFGFSERS